MNLPASLLALCGDHRHLCPPWITPERVTEIADEVRRLVASRKLRPLGEVDRSLAGRPLIFTVKRGWFDQTFGAAALDVAIPRAVLEGLEALAPELELWVAHGTGFLVRERPVTR